MPESPASMTARRARLAALVLAVAFCFTGLGNHPLRASDEPRVAGIGWEMSRGASLVPHLGGVPFLEHPPLYYACLGRFIGWLGATEAVARLPGAIASLATLLLVFAFGSRVATPRAGLAAVLALVGTRGFFRYSHKVLVDPLLMAAVTLGFYAYVRAAWRTAGEGPDAPERVRPGWLGVVYLAAGLAYYVKGAVGVVAIGGPIALDVVAARRWRVLASLAHAAGIPALLGVCASWPLLLHAYGGVHAVSEFLIQNGVYRVVPSAGAYAGGHLEPWWYYLPQVPLQVGWVLLLALAMVPWLARGEFPPSWRGGAIRFAASVLPSGVLLLSIPGTKRGLYLTPFLPPLAVAIGAWVDDVLVSGAGATRTRVERGVVRLCSRAIGWAGPAIHRVLHGGSAPVPGGASAPLDLLAAAFAIALAWNLIGYPLATRSGRDLGPFVRDVAAEVGDAGLASFALSEEMRGALPFYAGIVATDFADADALGRHLSGDGTRYAIAAFPLPDPLRAALGPDVRPVKTWVGAEGGYALIAHAPAAAE